MSQTWGVGLDATVERLQLDIRFRLSHKYGPFG